MSVTKFHRDFASFEFTFEYEGGKPYTERFSRSDVNRMVADADRRRGDWMGKPPSLSPRQP
jgi:hypothetical protein